MDADELPVKMEGVECPRCALPFAVPRTFFDARVADQQFFMCPNACSIQLGVESSSDRMVKALEQQLSEKGVALVSALTRNVELRRELTAARAAIVDLTVGAATAKEGA
ncbi:MAG: hypothetical protein ACYC0B_02260 [Gemmatimonadaceae bacterium]